MRKNFIQYITEAKVDETKLQSVMEILKQQGLEFQRKTKTGGTIAVYSTNLETRFKDTQKMVELIPGARNSEKRFGKDVYIDGNIKLEFHPKNKSGSKSAGLNNEKTFVDNINKLCNRVGSPITIVFKGANGVDFTCENVVGAAGVGTATSGRRKADVILMTAEGCKPMQGYQISLKKDNAEMWESGDTLLGPIAKKKLEYALEHKLTELVPYKDGTYGLTKAVCFPAGRYKKQVMFGSDIYGYGCIVQSSFAPIEFKEDSKGEEWFEIPVSYVIAKPDDVDDKHEPWVVIRRDATRNVKILGYPGLRVICYYKKYVTTKREKVILDN